MSNIQFIQVTPQDLAEIITDAVLKRLDAFSPIRRENTKETHKEILTREETAELLGVCPKTIDNRVKEGSLKKRTNGGKPYFFYSEIIQDLKESNNQ